METGDHVLELVQRNNLKESGIVDQTVRALESKGHVGVWIDVPDFLGLVHPKDILFGRQASTTISS